MTISLARKKAEQIAYLLRESASWLCFPTVDFRIKSWPQIPWL